MQIWKDIEGYKGHYQISNCKVCKGKGNLHKGYKWRYKK